MDLEYWKTQCKINDLIIKHRDLDIKELESKLQDQQKSHDVKLGVAFKTVEGIEAKLAELEADYDKVSAENFKLHGESIPTLEAKLQVAESEVDRLTKIIGDSDGYYGDTNERIKAK